VGYFLEKYGYLDDAAGAVIGPVTPAPPTTTHQPETTPAPQPTTTQQQVTGGRQSGQTFLDQYGYEDETPELEAAPEGVKLSDYAKATMGGGASLVSGLGWLAKKAGTRDFGTAIETVGNDAVDYWNESLSDAAKREIAKSFVQKNPDTGEWEIGDFSPATVGLMGAGSALSTMAGMGIGGAMTKMLQVFANPAGRAALVRAAEVGSKTALKKLKLVDEVLGAAGFGAGEGVVSATQTASQIKMQIKRLPEATLQSNERYRQLLSEQTGDSAARHAAAVELLAEEAAGKGAVNAGLVTMLLGAPMGAVFGRLLGATGTTRALTSPTTRAGAGAVGALGEAGQEFAQSGTEQLASNLAVREIDPSIKVFDEVLNQAVGGATAGGPLGGAFGLAAGGTPRARVQADQQAEAAAVARSPLRALDDAAEAARGDAAAAGGDPLEQELAASDAARRILSKVVGGLDLDTREQELLRQESEAADKRLAESEAQMAEQDQALGQVQGERRTETIVAQQAAYEERRQRALEAAREPPPEKLRQIAAERIFRKTESAAKRQKKLEVAKAEGQREEQIAEAQAPAFEEARAIGEVQRQAAEAPRPTLGDLMPTAVRNLGRKIEAVVKPTTPVMEAAPAPAEPAEFQKWVGKSKVVDEKGAPLVVYHGSTERGVGNYLTPNGAREVSGAVFFTDKQDVAEQYRYPREHGEIISSEYNPDTEEDEDIEPGDLVKAHLRIENPMVVDMEGGVGDALRLSKYVREAKEKGHDGLILKNVDDTVDSSGQLGTTYAVFDEKQIRKAATKKMRRTEIALAPAVPAEPTPAVPEQTVSDLERAAHEAATSPKNELPEPTEAQTKAGNYKKGHVTVQGLDISIENPVGSERTFTRPNGSKGVATLKDHYGYIKRTRGKDGDQLDVFVGDQPDSPNVYVIDQINQVSGAFDEHKAMLGYPNQLAAVRAYKRNYEAGFKVGPVSEMPIEQFRTWVKEGNLKAPLKRITTEKARMAVPASGLQIREAEEAAARRAPRKVRKPRVRYRLSGEQPAVQTRPMTLQKILKVLAPLRAAMPNVHIEVLDSYKQAPQQIQAEMEQSTKTPYATQGMYDPRNGRIYIFINANRSPEQLVKTLLHEVVGHHGLRALLGENINDVMQYVFINADPAGLQSIATLYNLDTNNPAHSARIAEEYVARIAETGQDAGVLQRVIDAVREALRAMGVVKEVTDNDIRALLRDVRKHLRGRPLSSVKIVTEAEIAETGEIVEIEENAEVALRQLQKRIDVVKKLRGCVG